MKRTFNFSPATLVLMMSALTTLSACGTRDDDNNSNQGVNQPSSGDVDLVYGYAFTRGPIYQSGQIERISLAQGNTVDATYTGTKSDHRLAVNGESVYQIGGYTIDNLTKYSATDPTVLDYQLSVLGDVPETSNPQALAFVSDDLAYLTRRSSDKLLMLDPTPEFATAESLIIGEISLAAYNRGSGETPDLPDMTDALIVNDELYVLLENLDGGAAPVNNGYIAVINTQTNLEEPTGLGTLPLKGIELQVSNPTSMHYNETTGLIYVVGRGNFYNNVNVTGDPYAGGVQSIDPITLQTNLLLDDGTQDSNNGFFADGLVINDTLGYLITLDGFDESLNSISNLRSFNPTTGEISDPIAGTEGQDLTLLEKGPDNHLWVGIQSGDSSGFIRIDLATGIPAQERVITNQIPSSLVFIDVTD